MLDLSKVCHLFDGPLVTEDIAKNVFSKCTLNEFMTLGYESWNEVRGKLKEILSKDCPLLRDDADLLKVAIVPLSQVKMHLPAAIGEIFFILSQILTIILN